MKEGAPRAERILGAARAPAARAHDAELDAVQLNGSLEHRLPGNLNVSFAFVEGEAHDDGHQGRRRLERLGLHERQPRAELRAARHGRRRRARPLVDSLRHRPVQHRRRGRLRGRPRDRQGARSCARCRRSTRCTRKASTSSRSSGLHMRTRFRTLVRERGAMAYSDKVIDHYENPRNVGTLDKDDPIRRAPGLVGAPACGDVMRLQIKVDDDGVIEDAKFKTFGCGSAIASSSLATEWLKGKTVDEASTIKNSDDRRRSSTSRRSRSTARSWRKTPSRARIADFWAQAIGAASRWRRRRRRWRQRRPRSKGRRARKKQSENDERTWNAGSWQRTALGHGREKRAAPASCHGRGKSAPGQGGRSRCRRKPSKPRRSSSPSAERLTRAIRLGSRGRVLRVFVRDRVQRRPAARA